MKPATLLPLLLAGVAVGQTANSPYDAAMATIQQRSEAADKAADPTNAKVWPGVMADRGAKTVTIFACATGIKRTEPVEFYVAPLDSGKDYEALTVTPAKPSDVDAALRFVGLKPGQPIDPDKNRFWARGPRLTMTFTVGGKSLTSDAVLIDTNTGKPIPGTVLFAGSRTTTDSRGHAHFAADEGDARPLAPDYEDTSAVLAVSRRAPQSQVYGFQKLAPAAAWKQAEAVDIVLTADPSGQNGEWEAFVHVAVVDGSTRYGAIARQDYGAAPASPPANDTLPHLVKALADAAGTNRSLWTVVNIDPDVPIMDVRKAYAVLQVMEKDPGIKLLPPADGELYYRAFLPDPQWRDRSKRLGEPWDLFLAREDSGTLAARLEHLAEDSNAAADAPPVLTSSTPADPAAFVTTINANQSKWSRAVFVYPPADLTYGELMAWVRPALATYPRIFVFPPQAATTQPATQP